MSTNRIIVFGGGTVLDEKGHALLHQASIERAERTIDYYKQNKESFQESSLNDGAFILCTGGYGLLSAGVKNRREKDREAVLMADYLIGKGAVPKELILVEKESVSTLTNWTRSTDLYGDRLRPTLFSETNKLGLVSHPHHLTRVMYLAEKLGYSTNALEKIPTTQVDNQAYEDAVLGAYRKYFENVHSPLEMEEKERELSNNLTLMSYLKNMQ